MEANHPSQDVKRGQPHEGPKNHLITFGLSIFLTLLAFLVVNYKDDVDATFVIIILIAMAVLQAVVQAIFWMHLKDRGHGHPRVFIAFGAVIAFFAVYTGIAWMWW